MTYENDKARQAARIRLQKRMERRDAGKPSARSPRRRPASSGTRRPKAGPTLIPGSASPASSRFSNMMPAVGIIAAVAMLIAIAGALLQCSASTQPGKPPEALASADAGASDSVVALEDGSPARQQLVDLIGEEETEKLVLSAQESADALWIATHAQELAIDGVEVQAKLLKLAANEPKALAYVRDFPTEYPDEQASDDDAVAMSPEAPSPEVPGTAVPHLYQWDRRWGYTTYSSAAFGLTGCGPTSLAMVIQGLTDQKEWGPHEVAQLAEERGFMAEFDGTAIDLFSATAPEFGLLCNQLYPTGDELVRALENGSVIVANLGPGQFTENGHFLVACGLTDDGRVIVNDPYSVVRSSQPWDADTIADESLALFAYSRA